MLLTSKKETIGDIDYPRLCSCKKSKREKKGSRIFNYWIGEKTVPFVTSRPLRLTANKSDLLSVDPLQDPDVAGNLFDGKNEPLLG